MHQEFNNYKHFYLFNLMLKIIQEFNKVLSIKYNNFTKFKKHLLPYFIFIVQCFKLVELQKILSLHI